MVVVAGDIRLADVRAAIARIDSDPRFSQAFSVLIDSRDVGQLPGRGEILEIARVITRNARHEATGAKRAVLVSSTVAYGVGRALELLITGARPIYRVFRNPAAAIEWLGWPAADLALVLSPSTASERGLPSDRQSDAMAEIAARLGRVRGDLTDEQFDTLVRNVARVTRKYE